MMNTAFRPAPDSTRALRDALGCFGTGVTVVTCRDALGPLAMTANSFTSVSLDPALVLWNVAKSSNRHDSFVAAQDFAIHILQDGQQELAMTLARDGRALPNDRATGLPVLEHCLVRLTCAQYAVHDAGDHSLIMGEVREVLHGTGAPLLFVQGAFGTFNAATSG